MCSLCFRPMNRMINHLTFWGSCSNTKRSMLNKTIGKAQGRGEGGCLDPSPFLPQWAWSSAF